MKTTRLKTAICGCALLLVAAALATTRSTIAQGNRPATDVLVVNSIDQPVPTTVTALPTVQVAVPPAVQNTRIISIPQSEYSTSRSLYTVPDGMRLVIDYVSYAYSTAVSDGDAQVRFRILTSVGGAIQTHDVDTLTAPHIWAGTSRLVKIYADAGATVTVIVERTGFGPAAGARLSFTGHLEPSS